MRAVVFLDRDGTINEEVGYIHNLKDLHLIPGAANAIARLNKACIAAILVTNQSGAARGYYDESHIQSLNKRLVDLLAAEGAFLDAIYYCPHLESGSYAPLALKCTCRKPGTGMVEMAYKEHPELDRKMSYVIGDKATDVGLAINCQAKSILVKTGYGQAVCEGTYQSPVQPDFLAGDISQAVDWILADVIFRTPREHESS